MSLLKPKPRVYIPTERVPVEGTICIASSSGPRGAYFRASWDPEHIGGRVNFLGQIEFAWNDDGEVRRSWLAGYGPVP